MSDRLVQPPHYEAFDAPCPSTLRVSSWPGRPCMCGAVHGCCLDTVMDAVCGILVRPQPACPWVWTRCSSHAMAGLGAVCARNQPCHPPSRPSPLTRQGIPASPQHPGEPSTASRDPVFAYPKLPTPHSRTPHLGRHGDPGKHSTEPAIAPHPHHCHPLLRPHHCHLSSARLTQ